MSRYSQDETFLDKDTVTYRSFAGLMFHIMTICLGGLFFGYGMAYFSIYPIQQIITQFKINMNSETLKGITNAIVPGGAFFGALLSSTLLKFVSRRQSLLIVAIIGAIGGGINLITNIYSLLIGRFIVGLAVGLYSSVCPLFINELSPPELAGMFGTFNQLFIVSGVVFTNVLTLFLSDDKQIGAHMSPGWRIVFSGTIIIACLQALLLIFVFTNQSPKYLILKNKDEQAKQLIEKLYLPQYSDVIFDRLVRDVRPEYGQSVLSTQYREPTNHGNSIIAILIGLNCAFLQQMSGINVIVLYCGDIFDQVISNNDYIKICRIFLQATSLISCFGTAFFIKKFGRKFLLQLGAFGIGAIIVVVGACYAADTNAAHYVIVACLYLFMVFFGFTLGPVVWLYIPQILKAKWIPFTTMTNWAGCVLTVSLFPILVDLMGTPLYTFFFLGAWCIASGAVNQIFLVESKDKTFAQIGQEYDRKFK